MTIAGERFAIVEADEATAVKWKNKQVSSAKIGPKGNFTGVGDVADSEPFLVSMCLRRVKDGVTKTGLDGEELKLADLGDAVDLKTVRTWPARVIRPIFERIKEVSDLNEMKVPDERRQFFAIINMDGSPLKDRFEDLLRFVEGLPDDKFGAVKRWIEPPDDAEEPNAKKALAG